MMKSYSKFFISIATAALCATAGLLVEIIGGVFAWALFRGIQGIILASVVGGFTALLIRRSTNWPASSLAGAVGAFLAAYFAISCTEVYRAGSLEWVIRGGLYGGLWGVSFAAILGPLGLLKRDHEAD